MTLPTGPGARHDLTMICVQVKEKRSLGKLARKRIYDANDSKGTRGAGYLARSVDFLGVVRIMGWEKRGEL